MAFNFYTAFHSAMQDPASYFSFQKEMNLKAVEQVFFNSLAGTTVFQAVILPEDIGTAATVDGRKAIRVRPLGIHDFIIPEPCSFKDPKIIKTILSMHPVAYPDESVPHPGGNDQNPDEKAYSSKVVECFFRDGPQSGGRLRGLTYRLKTEKSSASSLNLECLGISSDGTGGRKGPTDAQKAFKKGDYKQYEKPSGGETSPGVLKAKTDAAKKYVKESTRESIETYETSDGKRHSPSKKTYIGKVSTYENKKFENGLLPEELIGQSSSATGFHALLLKDVIGDFDRLAVAFKNKFNQKLKLNDSYRTFNEQIKIKDKKLKEAESLSNPEEARKKRGEAAKPGTSNHGWGLAFDFSTHYKGKKGFESETFDWMMRNAPRFGFHSPPILRDGAGTDESWHFEWININKIWS